MKYWNMLNKHEKAEVLSGLAYLITFFGASYHVLKEGDLVSFAVIAVGTMLAVVYGVEHLRAKRIEMIERKSGK